MRSPAEFDRVLSLAATHNKCEISRITGIPRSTVSGWLNGRAPRFSVDRTRGGTCLRCGGLRHPFPQLIGFQYAYLLGLYLGDGCLLRHPRGVYRLHVFLDSAYPIIAAECESAMSLVMPASRASCQRHPRYNMLGVVSYSKHWPHPLPPARSRGQAQAKDRVGAMAGANRRATPWAVAARPDPLRRLPRRQQDPPSEEDLRLSPLPSSPTARSTSSASSATPVIGSTSPGGRTGHGTSRSRGRRRSPPWTDTLARSGNRE